MCTIVTIFSALLFTENSAVVISIYNLKKIVDYKSKRKNDWLIFIDCNGKDPLITVAVHFLREGRFSAVLVPYNDKYLVHYSSHFLDRYNERFLKQSNISKLDLLKRFLPQNRTATLDITPFSSDQKDTVFARFKDGIGLGILEQLRNIKFVLLKTYISPEMIKENQQKHYESITKGFSEFWNDFLKIKRESPFD